MARKAPNDSQRRKYNQKVKCEKKKKDLREKGEEERNGGEPPLPGKRRKSLGFSLELGKAGKLKGQRCWKAKRTGTKKPLYAEILVLSAAIKLHSHNRTSECKMTLGRGLANAFRMYGALIQLRGVWTSKPCRRSPLDPRTDTTELKCVPSSYHSPHRSLNP